MFIHIVIFFVLFFGVFFAVVITVKLRQVRAAARWPSVPGEIVSSAPSSGQVTTHHATYDESEDKVEVRNYARITYQYTVAGQPYTCSRLSVGEDLGNDDVEGKLQRYPVGRAVQVFYDPADPAKAVLERDLPQGCAKAGLIGLGLIGAIIVFFGYGLDYAVSLIAPRMHDRDKASMVVFAGTFSLLCFWFTFALWNQGRVARRWLRAQGRILPGGTPGEPARIVYRYEVNGVSYTSDVVDFGGNKHTVFKLASGVTITGGLPDQTVEVRYDPADPAQACLYAGAGLLWLPLIAAMFMAGLTWVIFNS